MLVQLKPSHRLYEEMKTIIEHHLDDLAENRLPVIHKKTGYSLDLIREVRAEMHGLNPKPGAAFMEVFVPAVTPDVLVEQDAEGKYTVKLEDDSLPRFALASTIEGD